MADAALQAEYERLRSYHASQGERYSFAELWPRVTRARLDLLDVLDRLSPEAAAFRPGAGSWTIEEIGSHLLVSSRSARRIVECLSRGEPGDPAGVEAGRGPEPIGLDGLRRELRDDGVAWAALPALLPSHPSPVLTTPHPMFGPLHARAWYLFQRTHDLDHLRQIEGIQQAEGFPGLRPA